jgi:hypothetical protein
MAVQEADRRVATRVRNAQSERRDKLIQIAMLSAQMNGYPVEAWHLFEQDAEVALARMEQPDHHESPGLAEA